MGEKIRFKNYFNEDLVGILDNNKSGPAIIFVHGFCGNKDESNNLFAEASDYFSQQGMNTFRFDMSGAGESEGDFLESSLKKQASDLNAALELLVKEYRFDRIGLVGFSLGATVALTALNPHVDAYSLWSPALFPAEDMYPRYSTPEIIKALRSAGYIEKMGLKVGPKILNDLKNCNLGPILPILSKPIQIIHGTEDPYISHHSSIRATSYLTNSHELVLLEGASHSFKTKPKHRRKVFAKSTDWFKNTL